MSSLIDRMKAASNPNVIMVPFDPGRSAREQIEAAIASVKLRVCDRHPHEVLPVDKAATISAALCYGEDDYPYKTQPHQVQFTATYSRCSACPHNNVDHDIEVDQCAVICYPRFPRLTTRDEKGRPVPRRCESACLATNLSACDQFDAWLAKPHEFRCPFSNQLLVRRETHLIPPFKSWAIEPRFPDCVQCRLERLGITRDEAFASFDNLLLDPPVLQEFLDVCRAFAAAPKGVLLLLGNVGTGKTHLAIAIMRELLRGGYGDLMFVKHRHFVTQHALSLRAVPFGEKRPESPLARCQESSLLVYDDFTAPTDLRSYEDLFLDLFDQRNGQFKPSIITSNLNPAELETALGTRLFDRLRRSAFAALEFGFESKRKSLNAAYLSRSHG